MNNTLISDVLDRDSRRRFASERKRWGIKRSRVALDLGVPWFFIIATFFMFWVFRENIVFSSLAMIFLPFFISYWKLAYQMFFHEAAHFNLHKDKLINDFLANFFWTPFTGLWIASYRRHHYEHHKSFGTVNDTEISYITPLTAKNILEALCGIYLLKTVFRYFQVHQMKSSAVSLSKASIIFAFGIVYMLVTQFSISLFLTLQINWFAGICWLISLFVVDPLLAKVRQTLEHRNELDQYSDKFEENQELAVNQIFGNDVFSYYFGAVGFNKHLLHHLDPSVSYTRFSEFEDFLTKNGCKHFLDSRRSTYKRKFLELFSW